MSGQGLTLSERSAGFVQLFRHPHPPRRVGELSSFAVPTKRGESRVAPVDPPSESTSPKPPAMATVAEGLIAGREETETLGRAAMATSTSAANVDAFIALKGEGLRRPAGVASIFGVAFDDYISEDGVRAPPGMGDRAGVVGGAGPGDGDIEAVGVGGSGSGSLRAGVEEDRRYDAVGLHAFKFRCTSN